MKAFRSFKKLSKLRFTRDTIVFKKNLRKNNSKLKKNLSENNSKLNSLKVIKSLEQCLADAGLNKFILPTFTGQTKDNAAKTFINRIILFLQWSYEEIHKISLHQKTKVNILKFFSELISTHSDQIATFVDFLKVRKGLSFSTQRNYLVDISKAVDWFYLFRNDNSFPVSNTSFLKWKQCLKIVKKPITKAISLEQAKAKSLEDKIYDGIFPEKGLTQLKDCVHEEIEYIMSFKTNDEFIDKSTYNWFMCILYSSLYACGIQGRLSGIF